MYTVPLTSYTPKTIGVPVLHVTQISFSIKEKKEEKNKIQVNKKNTATVNFLENITSLKK